MLEIKRNKNDELILVLNGIEIEDTSLEGGPNIYKISIKNLESSQKLSNLCINDFPESKEISFIPYKLLDESVSIDVDIDLRAEKLDFRGNEFTIHIIPKQMVWKNIYTVNEYRELFLNNLKNTTDFNFQSYLVENSTIRYLGKALLKLFEGLPIILEISEDFSQRKISEIFQPYITVIEKVHRESILELLSKYKQNEVNAVFKFPEEIRVFCEQYLLYFAQFLQDLGINATSNLKEEAGKVLFSVIPTGDVEALDKIREALAVYLNLPSSPIVYDDSFAAMRLQQQIENLQHSQKMAARELQLTEKLVIAQSEAIKEKNIIISQKDSLIEQQNKVIEKVTSKSIMMDSLENKEELEEICEGLKIGESKFLKEQLGIHFNPAKVIKTGVNNLFGKGGEIISILDSDEETEKNS